MTEPRQAGTLARTHQGQPGLPRGRSRLPARDVLASQRDRLLRAVIAAVSEAGYHSVTVADIVRGARVSKHAFYEHFGNKEECFLTATGEGRELMLARAVASVRNLPAGASAEDRLRAAVRGYLAFLAEEPAFARVFYLHMPTAGAAAARRLDAAPRIFASLNQTWHERARKQHPEWPAVPEAAYLALAGAMAELVRSMVFADRTDALPDLEDTVVALYLAVMAGRPWPAPPQP